MGEDYPYYEYGFLDHLTCSPLIPLFLSFFILDCYFTSFCVSIFLSRSRVELVLVILISGNYAVTMLFSLAMRGVCSRMALYDSPEAVSQNFNEIWIS